MRDFGFSVMFDMLWLGVQRIRPSGGASFGDSASSIRCAARALGHGMYRQLIAPFSMGGDAGHRECGKHVVVDYAILVAALEADFVSCA